MATAPADTTVEKSKRMHKTLPIGSYTQCRLVRTIYRGTLHSLDLFDEGPLGLVNGPGDMLGGRVMRATKHKTLSRSYYNIYLPDDHPPARPGQGSSLSGSNFLIGRVVSNHKGTIFSILERTTVEDWRIPEDQVEWREVCSVVYEMNILGKNGPRRMAVLLRAVDPDGNALEPLKEDTALADRYFEDELDANIVALCNKLPKWNQETESYMLDFGGRVVVSSVKNFQLMHPEDEDYTVLQFGKVGPDSFTLDMRFPMTPVVAMGIAITSLDRKALCS